jgi:hypothetical protein
MAGNTSHYNYEITLVGNGLEWSLLLAIVVKWSLYPVTVLEWSPLTRDCLIFQTDQRV